MSDLRVQTNEVQTTIRFDKDTKIEGTIFLNKSQWDKKPRANKVSAYLEDSKTFLPFQVKGEAPTELINKNNIETMEWEDIDESIDEDYVDTSHKQEVTVTFLNNDTITGTLVSDPPPELKRLSDCLNTDDSFLHLIDGKRHVHVNKKVLLKVTSP